MDVWFFWKSLGIGLAVAAPVGPMSLLFIHRTLERGQASGLVFGAGVAAADLTYAAIAAFGVTAISALLLTGTFWIKIVGSLLLLMLGVRVALAPARPDDNRANSAGSGARAFLIAYGLPMTNPPTFLFFAGIFASLRHTAPGS